MVEWCSVWVRMQYSRDGTEAVPYGVIFAGCVFCALLQLIVSAS